MTPTFGLMIILVLAMSSPAQAHKVNLFAYAERGVVHVEGYFVDGAPSRDSRIVAYSPDGGVVAEGRTDAEGRYSFPVNRNENLRIVLEASMGHRNEILLTAAEIGGGAGSAPVKPVPSPGAADPATGGMDQTVASTADLQATLERVLSDQLTPLRESLMRIQQTHEKPGLRDVLGGLGYIVGLAGVYLWAVSRRKKE
jgi:nickel transport protein